MSPRPMASRTASTPASQAACGVRETNDAGTVAVARSSPPRDLAALQGVEPRKDVPDPPGLAIARHRPPPGRPATRFPSGDPTRSPSRGARAGAAAGAGPRGRGGQSLEPAPEVVGEVARRARRQTGEWRRPGRGRPPNRRKLLRTHRRQWDRPGTQALEQGPGLRERVGPFRGRIEHRHRVRSQVAPPPGATRTGALQQGKTRQIAERLRRVHRRDGVQARQPQDAGRRRPRPDRGRAPGRTARCGTGFRDRWHARS